MIFVQSTKAKSMDGGNQWLGFIDAMKKVIDKQDAKIRARFKRVNESIG